MNVSVGWGVRGLLGHSAVGKALDAELVFGDVHERNAGDFADTTTEFSVARGDDVAFVGLDALDDAVVGVRALV